MNDSGGILRAITTTVIGSSMGSGRGNTLAGGLRGAHADSEVGKANAQALTIDQVDGASVVVISKGQELAVGQGGRIVIEDGRWCRWSTIE